MKLLQINVTANWGSTGRIAEQIGQLAIAQGWESYIAYGRGPSVSGSRLIRIGSKWEIYWHVLMTRLFDRHGLASKRATKRFIEQIKEIQPDIIHLHNVHGYYLNYELLFHFLAEYNRPIVWTLHDCWPFTGHCAHFMEANCMQWQTLCKRCPLKRDYPASVLFSRSASNFMLKKRVVTGLKDLMKVVPVSDWLHELLNRSFMHEIPAHTIHNGIDMSVFVPRDTPSKYVQNKDNRFVILGVASVWTASKGLDDFYKLRTMLPQENYAIVLVGVTEKQSVNLPKGIQGISRTENVDELAALYSTADVFVNPTYSDNYPTTNLEAMACGTPVITYRTGGSPEAVTEDTGFVVDQGDVRALADAIKTIRKNGKKQYSEACRQHAEQFFDKDKCYQQYVDMYKTIIKENNDVAR